MNLAFWSGNGLVATHAHVSLVSLIRLEKRLAAFLIFVSTFRKYLASVKNVTFPWTVHRIGSDIHLRRKRLDRKQVIELCIKAIPADDFIHSQIH